MNQRLTVLLLVLLALAVLGGADYWYTHRVNPSSQNVWKEGEGEEQEALILQLVKKNYFVEFGNRDAPTQVVAYVPDHACHDQAVAFLIKRARAFPTDLHVRIIRMHSAEGMKELNEAGKGVCARYEINGENTVAITHPDGSSVQVAFKAAPRNIPEGAEVKAPPGAGWQVEDLMAAVEQSIAKAKGTLAQQPVTSGAEGSLLTKLLGEKSVGEWGNPGAPTKVVAYVPEAACHEPCISFLVDTAKSDPTKLHVRIVRMFKPEGGQITIKELGKICAGYFINGSSSPTITLPDGTTQQVTLERSPEQGAFTPEQLKMAVQQAIEKQQS